MRGPVKVLLVDDHEIVREGLRTLLDEEPDVEVVGEAADGLTAVELARRLEPEVILLDLAMPGLGGIETLRRLREESVTAQVVVLTSFADERLVQEAIAAGALGYLLKDVSRADLLRALHSARAGVPALHPEAQRFLIRRVCSPEPPSPFDELTPRERDVLRLIAEGRSNREISATLHLSEGTVKGYVSSVLAKLGAEHRTQAALLAVKHGLP